MVKVYWVRGVFPVSAKPVHNSKTVDCVGKDQVATTVVDSCGVASASPIVPIGPALDIPEMAQLSLHNRECIVNVLASLHPPTGVSGDVVVKTWNRFAFKDLPDEREWQFALPEYRGTLQHACVFALPALTYYQSPRRSKVPRGISESQVIKKEVHVDNVITLRILDLVTVCARLEIPFVVLSEAHENSPLHDTNYSLTLSCVQNYLSQLISVALDTREALDVRRWMLCQISI